MSIQTLFADWVDYDIAAYYVTCLLGLTKYDENSEEYRRIKGLYWTGNKVSDSLYSFLENLVEAGILEKNDDLGYRYNKDFDQYWLNK